MKKLLATTLIAVGLSASLPAAPAHAGSDPFLGQISWVGFNFAPRGWAFCDGQILPINSNQSLYSLLGTTYGGDGRTTFALPDMRSRTIVHKGQASEGVNWVLGQKGGAETTTYTQATMAAHSHSPVMKGSSATADASVPGGLPLGSADVYTSRGAPDTDLVNGSVVVQNAGGGQAVNNMQPTTVLHCIIALQGLFPSRN